MGLKFKGLLLVHKSYWCNKQVYRIHDSITWRLTMWDGQLVSLGGCWIQASTVGILVRTVSYREPGQYGWEKTCRRFVNIPQFTCYFYINVVVGGQTKVSFVPLRWVTIKKSHLLLKGGLGITAGEYPVCRESLDEKNRFL